MKEKRDRKSNLYDSVEGYQLYANQYDETLEYLDSFEGDVAMRLLGDLEGKKVLDIGCGTGRMMRSLLDLGGEVTGCDPSEEMLKLCRQKFPRIQTALCGMEKMPFEDGSFDVATAMFVIVHMKNLEKGFDEVYRVLKEGGSFILTNINQRKAPKIKLKGGEEIVIDSFYHMPKHVLEALDRSFFKIEAEEFVYEDGTWINQIIKAKK